MLLILCPLDDLDTLAFAHRVIADGVPCQVLTAEALSFARRRSQRLSAVDRAGHRSIAVRTEIELVGAPPLLEHHFTGVLNRMVEPPTAAWHRADAVERDYAAAELFAFTLSWLTALACPVRNRPLPGCLAGPVPHPLAMLVAARRAGLQCPPMRYRSRSDLLVGDLGTAAFTAAGPGAHVEQLACLDGTVLTPGVPAGLAELVRRFVAALDGQHSLIGVDFAVRGSRWIFAGLTPLPALATAGQPLYRALLDSLGVSRTDVAR